MGYKRGPGLAAFSQQEVITGANGMDGISALGVAGRALPADILSVSYPVTDTIGEAGANTASDEARILKVLETAGLKVLEISQRFLSLDEPERAGYFSSGSPRRRQKPARTFNRARRSASRGSRISAASFGYWNRTAPAKSRASCWRRRNLPGSGRSLRKKRSKRRSAGRGLGRGPLE